MNDWKSKTILFGALIGTAAGIAAALIMIKRANELDSPPQLTAGDGVKLGLGVLGLLRLVAEFSNPKS